VIALATTWSEVLAWAERAAAMIRVEVEAASAIV
jgi:hypothetical protein